MVFYSGHTVRGKGRLGYFEVIIIQARFGVCGGWKVDVHSKNVSAFKGSSFKGTIQKITYLLK